MFYYTNFIVQTNTWWLRRVRPVWMGAVALYCLYVYQRYYFFGKNSTKDILSQPPQVWQKRAQFNKRNYGFGTSYKPTLERSRKKQILQAMGQSYDPAVLPQERFTFIVTMQELYKKIEDENNY